MKVYIGNYKEEGREVDVEISEDDIWSLDQTLSLVIVEALKKFLKTNKDGFSVLNKHVPKKYRSETDSIEVDELYMKRYRYVMKRMIWSFEQIANDENEIPSPEAFAKKVQKGLDLFAHYFRRLWI